MDSSALSFYLVTVIFYILRFARADDEIFFHNHIGLPPPGEPDARAVQPIWGNITQRLDHFNLQDNRTWTMRYLYNDQFFQNGGPIVILLGGEWVINPNFIMSGQTFEIARQHNGYMFYTQHRFYGKSLPTKDFSVESLKYLSADQALEDIAHFIQHQRALPKFRNSSVVVIGLSYSGMLSAWMRLKYPHLVDIAYSSSAPVLAKAKNDGYVEVVSEVIGKTNETCAKVIQKAISITEELLKTPEGIAKVKEAYRLCSWKFISEEPYRSYLFEQIFLYFVVLVQSGEDVAYHCDLLIKGGQNPFEQLTNFFQKMTGNSCRLNYDTYIDILSSSTINSNSYLRQWYYQVCTEYGFHKTTYSEKQIFGHNLLLPYYYQFCQKLYGSKFGPEIQHYGIDRTNLLYGGVNPKLSYVLFVHGSHDPWHRLGVLKNLTSLSPVIVIEGAAHGKDLGPVDSNDTPQLAQAKRQIQTIISDWLKQIN